MYGLEFRLGYVHIIAPNGLMQHVNIGVPVCVGIIAPGTGKRVLGTIMCN